MGERLRAAMTDTRQKTERRAVSALKSPNSGVPLTGLVIDSDHLPREGPVERIVRRRAGLRNENDIRLAAVLKVEPTHVCGRHASVGLSALSCEGRTLHDLSPRQELDIEAGECGFGGGRHARQKVLEGAEGGESEGREIGRAHV